MSVGIYENGEFNKVAGNAKEGSATNTTYINSTSGLQANNVQGAIDELVNISTNVIKEVVETSQLIDTSSLKAYSSYNLADCYKIGKICFICGAIAVKTAFGGAKKQICQLPESFIPETVPYSTGFFGAASGSTPPTIARLDVSQDGILRAYVPRGATAAVDTYFVYWIVYLAKN